MFSFSTEIIDAIFLSMYVALFSVMIATPIAVLTIWHLHTHKPPYYTFVNALIQLPLVIPPVALGYILILILGKKGIMGEFLFELFNIQITFSTSAAIIAAIIVSFPLIANSIKTAFEMSNNGLEDAAATLGASPLRQFFTITLPGIMPGIISGSIIGFARALGEFGATITFAGNIEGVTQTLPLRIYTLLQTPGKENETLFVTGISVILALGSITIATILTKRYKQ